MSDTRTLTRRQALGALTGATAAVASACGGSSPTAPTSPQTDEGTTTDTPTPGASCAVTPSETAGPYPDRTGMLGSPAFYRQDVTEGRPGVQLTLALAVQDAASCTPIADAAVEIWQCDAGGHYSEYSQPG